MYKLFNDFDGNPRFLLRLADQTAIPFCPDNTDYQQYLAWLAEGNEPLPADEGESN